MKNKKNAFALILSAVAVSVGLGALAACGEQKTEKPIEGGKTSSVAGTYSVTYSKEQLSGNVRHTGYLTALGCHETNTVVLKDDGTYEYTKLVTNAPEDGASATSLSASPVASVKVSNFAETAEAESGAFLTWTSAGDGNCTLECYADGTYKFTFISYNMTETGKWSWSNWTFTLTPDGGETLTATMDDSYSLNLHYVAVAGGGALTHDFTCPSSVWGVALGQTGSYTPVESGEDTSAPVYYTGTGKKTGGGVEYDVTVQLFLVSGGKVYCVESTDTNSTKSVGSWTEENGIISVTLSDETTTVSDDKITIGGIELSLNAELPDEYKNADFDALIEEAETPVVYSDYITISYTFKGTYTADGDTVTLSAATSCVWSEDWASLQARGFTNCSGTEKDVVTPKGSTGETYLPLDHFGGQYYFATVNAASVSNNNAQKIKLSGDTFEYIIESVFD